MDLQSTMSSQEFFNKQQSQVLKRSTFDRSHTYKTTFNAGVLIPFYVDEALPSDTVALESRAFGRLATPLKPIMDNIFLDTHFFSVPLRLVWNGFKSMMGEQDPSYSGTNMIPISNSGTGLTELSNHDYMGLPTKVPNLDFSNLPLRALRLIWGEYYRDQDLEPLITPYDKSDGPDVALNYAALYPRAKRRDYFTSGRPWAQKGQPVHIPVSSNTSNVISNQEEIQLNFGSDQPILYGITGGTGYLIPASAPFPPPGIGGTPAIFGAETGLQVALSANALGTIDQLNAAYKIQTFLQADSRGGTRYTELIQQHFGVVSPDARLQRPEFLGGSTTYVNVNPVAQTSNGATGTTPQGNLAAYGTFSGEIAQFNKTFTEHEIIIGVISARADLTYQQGLDRMWSRRDRFDFYWREFANLGEQAVYNKEIYAQGANVLDPVTSEIIDDQVFCYQERFAEYKYKQSKVTGLFRSNASTSLDVWHLAQEFTGLPQLGYVFIHENPPIDRVVAVPSEPQFIVDIVCQEKWTRPMPVFAIPTLSTNF